MPRQHSKANQRRDFPYAGITVFVLFFGTSLIEAIGSGRWWNVLFWTAMGLAFLVLDNTPLPDERHE